MDKRSFLKALFAAGGLSLVTRPVLTPPRNIIGSSLPPLRDRSIKTVTPEFFPEIADSSLNQVIIEEINTGTIDSVPLGEEQDLQLGFQHYERTPDVDAMDENEVSEYLSKIRNFDNDFNNDILLSPEKSLLLDATINRLEAVQNFVGHGNFNLLGFDEMIFFSNNYEAIGAFTREEMDFIDEVFHIDASDYGFFGDKVVDNMTNRVNMADVVKIRGSGHYLIQGESLHLYEQMRDDVGDKLLLTSGVRNVVKQLHLFLAKVQQADGNLSKASRSLAPPGYSFHGIGDFDVGKIGLGERNFTSHFSTTAEFQHMITLGYVDIRYTDTNRFGVRYEPWHIKIV